jgi:hypothetical protein
MVGRRISGAIPQQCFQQGGATSYRMQAALEAGKGKGTACAPSIWRERGPCTQ